METAVNIAFSCGHFKRTMNILEMSGTRCTEEMLLRFKYLSATKMYFQYLL